MQDDSSRQGMILSDNDRFRPIYDEEPMAEVQLTTECNIFAIGQQHTEQPEIHCRKVGFDDHIPETCQVKSPMLDSSPDNQTTEYSKQSLKSENILLKETVAQFQKDFSRMEAHCIALELKYQNQSLKSGQHGQILNETSNKAKIEKEIDVLETMNIELEHSVATLRHRFSPNKTSAVSEKTSPRSDLRWKPTGRIFKTVGLSGFLTGKKPLQSGFPDDRYRKMTSVHNSSGLKPQCPNDVCSQQFRPQTSMSKTVCSLPYPFLKPQCQMTSVHNSSGLKPQCQMTSVHNSSGLKPQCQMTFNYNRSSLEPQCQMTFEQNGSSLAPKCQQKFIKQLRQ
ncbi:hypothetical protein Tco_1142940 [Tanacetum coccineum]